MIGMAEIVVVHFQMMHTAPIACAMTQIVRIKGRYAIVFVQTTLNVVTDFVTMETTCVDVTGTQAIVALKNQICKKTTVLNVFV